MDCNYRSMGICRFVGVAVAGPKRRHLNPIVTLGLAFRQICLESSSHLICRSNDWSYVRRFLSLAFAQRSFAATEDEAGKLACFSTRLRNYTSFN
jgi:hypothetical protein